MPQSPRSVLSIAAHFRQLGALSALAFVLTGVPSSVRAQSGSRAVVVTAPDGWSAKHQDGVTVLTPTNLPQGREIALQIEPEVAGDGAGNRSLLDAARSHPFPFLGRRTTEGKFSRIDAIPGGIGQIDGFVAPDGTQRIVVYFIVPRAGGRAVVARAVMGATDSAFYKPYLAQANQIIRAIANGGRSDSGGSNGAGRGSDATVARHGLPEHTTPMAYAHSAYTVAPGKGVSSSQIAGVYAEQRTIVGAGGFPGVVFEPILALRDGTRCGDFDIPPDQFDARAYKRDHPDHWARWRTTGSKKYEIEDKGKWEGINWIGPLTPSPGRTRLSGAYSSIGGGGSLASGVSVVGIHEFHFRPDGHFTLGSSVTGSAPGAVVGASSGGGGTYAIDGYAMTLHYDDGRTERRSFVFLDAGNKHDFYLSGSQYAREDGR